MLTLRFEGERVPRRVSEEERVWARRIEEGKVGGWDWEPAGLLRPGDWSELTESGPPGRVSAVEGGEGRRPGDAGGAAETD